MDLFGKHVSAAAVVKDSGLAEEMMVCRRYDFSYDTSVQVENVGCS